MAEEAITMVCCVSTSVEVSLTEIKIDKYNWFQIMVGKTYIFISVRATSTLVETQQTIVIASSANPLSPITTLYTISCISVVLGFTLQLIIADTSRCLWIPISCSRSSVFQIPECLEMIFKFKPARITLVC